MKTIFYLSAQEETQAVKWWKLALSGGEKATRTNGYLAVNTSSATTQWEDILQFLDNRKPQASGRSSTSVSSIILRSGRNADENIGASAGVLVPCQASLYIQKYFLSKEELACASPRTLETCATCDLCMIPGPCGTRQAGRQKRRVRRRRQ